MLCPHYMGGEFFSAAPGSEDHTFEGGCVYLCTGSDDMMAESDYFKRTPLRDMLSENMRAGPSRYRLKEKRGPNDWV